jgi:ribonucleoside-diphosphate reductase alpha chain
MGDNAIHYLGHVKMMSAVQPFLSGAISKTVNMPEEVTVEEVEQLHLDAWKMGLKAVAIYRDNCKVAQPLSMAKKEGSKDEPVPEVAAHTAVNVEQAVNDVMVPRYAIRKDLPRVRNSKTFKFTVGGVRGYAIVGEYEDGTPGELFISSSKMGSTLRGVMDAFGVSVSYGLQFGVPLKNYVRNFTHTSFAPAGITDDPEIRTASSIIDYIFKRLGKTYLSFDDQLEVGLAQMDDMPTGQASLLDEVVDEVVTETEPDFVAEVPVVAEASPVESPAYGGGGEANSTRASTAAAETVSASTSPVEYPANSGVGEANSTRASQPVDEPVAEKKLARQDENAPLCYNCGNQTMRAGTCYVCTSCGSTTGCS